MNAGMVVARIAPAACSVFLCFVGIGATVTALPLYLNRLGFSSLVVGIVVAVQYVAMFLARPAAGKMIDRNGAKAGLLRGAAYFLVCGAGYVCATLIDGSFGKLAVLVAARLSLGVAESYIVTGALAWAMRHVGASHAGMVMAWNGNAMYGGLALGAPLAGLLGDTGAFWPVAVACLVLAGCGGIIIFRMHAYDPLAGRQPPFLKTFQLVIEPGLGLLLASVGYGMILGFANLFFLHNGWQLGYLAVFGFGLTYVAARLFFGGLPDKYGGARIALWSLGVEVLGQTLLLISPNEYTALLGCALSGAGFSLVVPALGVEAIRRTPQQSRGSAMAGYLAFFDLAFGVAIPLAGLAADMAGIRIVYLLGLSGALGGLIIAKRIERRSERERLGDTIPIGIKKSGRGEASGIYLDK